MSKKQLLARIEQLEQRIAALEAQNAPLRQPVPYVAPYIPWDQRGPHCVGIAQTGAMWSDNVAWYSGRDKEPS